MHRTTILLPEELLRKAEIHARKQGLSVSALIRAKLSEAVSGEESPEMGKQAFFLRKPWTGEVPPDLALRHDDYLYGTQSGHSTE